MPSTGTGLSRNSAHSISPSTGFAQVNNLEIADYNEDVLFSDTIFGSIENDTEHSTQFKKRNVIDETGGIGLSNKRKRALRDSLDESEVGPEIQELRRLTKEAPTRQFQNIFKSAGEANESFQSILTFDRRPSAECTFPPEDASFPLTAGDHIVSVKRVFDAICDWSSIWEWKAVLPKGEENWIIARLQDARSESNFEDVTILPGAEDFIPTPEELVGILPPVEVQQQKVLRQIPSDQTIELISWGIVVGCFYVTAYQQKCNHSIWKSNQEQGAAIKSQQGLTQVPYWCVSEGG